MNPNKSETSEKNIKWHEISIDRKKLEKLHGHQGMVVWFTGLSGSGKSTLANALNEALYSKGISTYVLDGDNIRHKLKYLLNVMPHLKHLLKYFCLSLINQ